MIPFLEIKFELKIYIWLSNLLIVWLQRLGKNVSDHGTQL